MPPPTSCAKKKKNAPPVQGGSSSHKKKKQGTLYSFFSVAAAAKPKATASPRSSSTAAVAVATPKATSQQQQQQQQRNGSVPPFTAKAAATTTKSTNTKSNNTKSTNNTQWKRVKLNMKLAVYWRDDKKYYACVVKKRQGNDGTFFLEYEDGESEWIDLRQETFRFLDDDDADMEEEDHDNHPPPTQKKRPRIHDSDDEEFEFDMDDASDDDDDGEAFEEGVEDEEEEADQWLVSDVDDEDGQPQKKKRAQAARTKKTKVIQHEAASAGSSPSSATRTPSRPACLSSSSDRAAATLTPTALTSFSAFSQSSAHTNAPRRVTPPSSGRASATSIALDSAAAAAENSGNGTKALPYIMGEVNPTGSHVHNHVKFLLHPRDARGRTKDQPGYDPRTLTVDQMELQRHNANTKKKWSPGIQQWWETKAQYFDTVLLFKTGKFYEMFHMDADAGVQVCGFQYMKGHVAHAGFPEISYGIMADKLVRAGYKVARVEQTETPEMLKERKKKLKGGNLPKVVNREVCSIVTLGTRTFCYLDKDDLENDGQLRAETGPLLVIREIQMEADAHDEEEQDMMRPVCEYGIVVVDAARAKITIGQFADDVLRSRMSTLLAAFAPSEILVEGGDNGASPTLRALLKSVQATSASTFLVEEIHPNETFPKSTAVDANVRRKLERNNGKVQPWDVDETLQELHRRGYFPRGSKQQQDSLSTNRWPKTLRQVIEGNANLALSSLGAALFYLQRSLIDQEILSMGDIIAYIPPASAVASEGKLSQADCDDFADNLEASAATPVGIAGVETVNEELKIKHMSIDGNTLCQLEILTNSIDHKPAGSLWSKINFTKTPHGARLLRAWLLRPLFRKDEIDRRADAVEELLSGDLAMAMDEATLLLGKCGDIERLLAKIHALSGSKLPGADEESTISHPSARAVLYEMKTYTKRKVGDFSKVLNGLRSASKIPELFAGLEIQSGLVKKIVKTSQDGGCFPDISEDLDWFFSVFDFDKAAKGEFEPERGVDGDFDEACDAIDQIQSELEEYKKEMCSNGALPAQARSTWKYTNTAQDSKDKYTIELPKSVKAPDYFRMVGKRGSGAKQINKYRSPAVDELVVSLERAIEVHKERKARQMQHIFAKFDERRNSWAAVASCTALLDALGSLSKLASKPGYCRPRILDCPVDANPCIKITQGRHPCVETTPGSGEFIPNDLTLGSQEPGAHSEMVLLLSGCNMGGKSTLLRQTCLISILAQIGGFVPAAECELTPFDNIMTRLGASDRILLGQSTFFVELAETAAALRGASRRSLILFDELGRGTSSFDGTAIASACLSYICNSLKCLSLFATHYHSLLDERKDDGNVRLAHMESTVDEDDGGKQNITFLYQLCDGAAPASFGINVARLARLPEEVLEKAKRVSSEFETEMKGEAPHSTLAPVQAVQQKQQLMGMIEGQALDAIEELWEAMQQV